MAPPFRLSPAREVSMPSAQLEIETTEQLLMVVPWLDPVVDSIGYEGRSQYVELFWVNVLGPPSIQTVQKPIPPRLRRAGVYVRISQDRDKDDPTRRKESPARQLEDCSRLV